VAWLGADGLQYDYALTYIRIVVLDMPLLYMINIYSSVHQAQGDTVSPMLLNLIGVIVNLIMDPLLMVHFRFGIAGAAFATLAAKFPGALIALIALTRPGQIISIRLRGFRFEKEKMMNIIRIGLPTAIGGSTMQFGFLLMTRNVQIFGKTATTAYGIGNKINSIITLPNNGIGNAISTIVGLNIGASNKKRADKSYHTALRLAAVYLLIAGLILSRRPVAEFMVRTLTTDEAVVPLAADFLSLMAFWCWNNAFYNVTMGLFQGSGHTMVTMTVDASRLWIFRFMTLFICQSFFNMGVESVWVAVVVSNAASAAVLYIMYWTGIWKKDVLKKKGYCSHT
jgi:putative MATE family efflux protein